MKEKTTQSSTSMKVRLLAFSIAAVFLVLAVIFSNMDSEVETEEVNVPFSNGPSSLPSVVPPEGPPPAS